MGKHDPMKDVPEVIALKARAKEIRDMLGMLTQSQAIEMAAKELGFKTYAAFRASLKERADG